MKALATFCKGPMKDVWDLTRDNMRRYARRHGYAFIAPGCGGDSIDGFNPDEWSVETREKHPSWGKIDLVRKALLSGFKTVLWLDADVMIVDQSKDIVSELHKDTELGYINHHTNYIDWQIHPNAGVFVVRNPEIMDDVERYGRSTDHERALKAWDQPGFLSVVGIDLDWRFKKRLPDDNVDPPWNPPKPYKMQELGHEWNYTRVDLRPLKEPLRFAHYSGMSNEQRVKSMKSHVIGRVQYELT